MDIFKSFMPKLEHEYCSDSELEEYDLEDLYKTNAQAAFYWYAVGSYEGTGQVLILKEGKWYLHDCGHCSCYGPMEHLDLKAPIADSLTGVRDKCSVDLWIEVEPLVLLAESKGYGVAINE